MGMETWILVVDDDLATREALAEILRRAGFGVEVWAGDVGLENLCARRRFKAAVLDYHLPSKSGLEVARRLKELQADCHVILISSEPPDLTELPEATVLVDRFLAKPFSRDALLDLIGQLGLTAPA